MAASLFKTIGILGTGTIGSALASFYATRGLKVRLFDKNDQMLKQSKTTISNNLKQLLELELTDKAAVEKAKRNLQFTGSISEMAEGAEFIHECVLERYEVKKEVFSEMDKHAGASALIASSSSGLLITEIQKVMKHPGRSLIAHPFNPPHLVPLMELVPGEQTDPETISVAREFFKAGGKIPVVLKKEVPGHIANRLAAALWREATDLVASGVADVEDVDKALFAGPGIRWAFMGQHLIYHLGGGDGGYEYFMDHIGVEFNKYWKSMAAWEEMPAKARDAVLAGMNDSVKGKKLPEIREWRDKKLGKLLKAIYNEDPPELT